MDCASAVVPTRAPAKIAANPAASLRVSVLPIGDGKPSLLELVAVLIAVVARAAGVLGGARRRCHVLGGNAVIHIPAFAADPRIDPTLGSLILGILGPSPTLLAGGLMSGAPPESCAMAAPLHVPATINAAPRISPLIQVPPSSNGCFGNVSFCPHTGTLRTAFSPPSRDRPRAMSPPWMRAMSRAMASPRPVEPAS
jgi:hypothetical protein